MAMNNELNAQIKGIQVGTQAASIQLPGMKVSHPTRIRRVSLINQAALAADDTNYLQVQLCKLSDNSVVSEVSTKLTGGEGSLVKNQPLDDAGISDASPLDLAAGDVLYVNVIKNGTGVPTLAILELEMFQK